MSGHETLPKQARRRPERLSLGRRLQIIGVVGLIAAVLFGVLGWLLVGRMTTALTRFVEPMGAVVANISDTVEASSLLVSRTTEALTSIESATRSTARTVESVNGILGETSQLAGSEVADSLDSALAALPGLISTARVVDGTMRTLSLLGVDYDPEQPLDDALTELQTSLSPVPDQIREQAELLEQVRSDSDLIVGYADELSAVLLRTRIEMRGAQQVLADAAINAAEATEGVTALEDDLDGYGSMARLVTLAAAIALMMAAAAPFLIGSHTIRQEGRRG